MPTTLDTRPLPDFLAARLPDSANIPFDELASRVHELPTSSTPIHLLDNDLLIAKPVVLAATAGTARHALVVDEQMRSLFAYLRTMTVPTSVFAATEDWNSKDLGERITRAAIEVLLLMESGFAEKVRSESWKSYQHEYGSAGGTELDIDLSSDLMRLAAGGSVKPPRKP